MKFIERSVHMMRSAFFPVIPSEARNLLARRSSRELEKVLRSLRSLRMTSELRFVMMAIGALMFVPFVTAAAQSADSVSLRHAVPRQLAEEIAARWNGPAAIRAADRLEIGAAQTVQGNVDVRVGPLFVAGHVAGDVLAIDSDVLLSPNATIDGDLIVIGGDVEGRDRAHVAGDVRIYREPMSYRVSGDSLLPEEAQNENDPWAWRRALQRHWNGNWSNPIRIATSGPYNRVEGLPFEVGPTVNEVRSWGSVRVDAAAVLRTGSTFRQNGDVGHDVRAQIRSGHHGGVGFGAEAFNVVSGVEPWQLSDLEVGMASFLARRDYRDYYQRHGGLVSATGYLNAHSSLTASYGQERWSSRVVADPFTLFHAAGIWRPNPQMDAGLYHMVRGAFLFDTRTDPDEPWSGWYVQANAEHGVGTTTSFAPASTRITPALPARQQYSRALMDLRRYNRLSPASQVNLRVVLGGWIGGDQLPLERRLSVDGPGVLPGFDFRSPMSADVGTCTNLGLVAGQPTECERIALGQIEYRGDLHFDLGPTWDAGGPRWHHAGHSDAVWVLFADAGRGWQVHAPGSPFNLSANALPSLSTFRSDAGLGLDFGVLGLYAAKALSDGGQPVNFFVRLQHRF